MGVKTMKRKFRGLSAIVAAVLQDAKLCYLWRG